MRVIFLVNGEYESAMGIRARSFADGLKEGFDIAIEYRAGGRIPSITTFVKRALRFRPHVTYVFDMAVSGVLAGAILKLLSGTPLIIETGDAIAALAHSMGRGAVGLELTRLLEKLSFLSANHIVVRSHFHGELLAARGLDVSVIPDGVDVEQFRSCEVANQRSRQLTVGLIGSIVWSQRLGICYGWELIETIRLLRTENVRGVVIGDGSGISYLKELCRQYGIVDRIQFLGRIPYNQLPRQLNQIDVCLSTQTNDLPGQVRTTGKLPLYMAAGRYVLASRVGEAARVLDDDMLVEYNGTLDPQYPKRLTERIHLLLSEPERLQDGTKCIAKARAVFDYAVLVTKLRAVLTGQALNSTMEQTCPTD